MVLNLLLQALLLCGKLIRQQELHLERLRQAGEAITKKVSCYAQYESRTLVSGPIEDLENRYPSCACA